MPIYHPTTTLVMVVYGEAGRGRITFLGKLHYRISYLMYLNHRSASTVAFLLLLYLSVACRADSRVMIGNLQANSLHTCSTRPGTGYCR